MRLAYPCPCKVVPAVFKLILKDIMKDSHPAYPFFIRLCWDTSIMHVPEQQGYRPNDRPKGDNVCHEQPEALSAV